MKLRRCSRQCSDRRDQVWDRRLIEKLVLYITYKKIGVVGPIFVPIATPLICL